MDQETKKKLEDLTAALDAGGYDAKPEKIVASTGLQVKAMEPVGLSDAAKEAMAIVMKRTETKTTKCIYLAEVVHGPNPELVKTVAGEIVEIINTLAERGWLRGSLAPLSSLALVCREESVALADLLDGVPQPTANDTAVFAFVHVPIELHDQIYEEFKVTKAHPEGSCGRHRKG